MKKLVQLNAFLSTFLLTTYVTLRFSPPVWAQIMTMTFEEQDEGKTESDLMCLIDGVVTIRGIECLLTNIFTIAISGIGFAGFVMLIVGSFQYLLSGGNAKGVEGGKNTMTYALIGLVVSLTSFLILNFIATFTGVKTILRFTTFFSG